jgi:hypothetical protein
MESVWVEIDGVGEVYDFGFDTTDSQFALLTTDGTFTLTGYASAFSQDDVGQVLVTEIFLPQVSPSPLLAQTRRDRWVIVSVDAMADDVELGLIEGRIISRIRLATPFLSTAARYFAWVERKTRYHHGPRPQWAPNDGSWVEGLHTVGDLSGSPIPLEGGIATPPGTSVQLAYSAPAPPPEVARLARSRYPFMAYDGNASVPVAASWRPETRVPPTPSNDTTPSRGVTWPGLVCIGPEVAYVRAGDDPAAFRGALDTSVFGIVEHTVFTGWPSARSSTVRVYRAGNGAGDIRDAVLLFAGRCNDVRMSDDGASLQLSCAGLLAVAAERRASVPEALLYEAIQDRTRVRDAGGAPLDTFVYGETWLRQFEGLAENQQRLAIIGEVKDLGEWRRISADPDYAVIPEQAWSSPGAERALMIGAEFTRADAQFCHFFSTRQFSGLPEDTLDSLSFLGSPIGIAGYRGDHTVHVVEALLQILTSTGGGQNAFAQSRYYSTLQPADDWPAIYEGQPAPNAIGATGDFDVVPRGFGLGVPAGLIDLESFLVVASMEPAAIVRDMTILADEAGDVFSVIEEKLLKPYFLVLTTGSDGRIRLVDMGRWGYMDRDLADRTYAADGTLASVDRAIPSAAWAISETPPVERVQLRQHCYYVNPREQAAVSGVTVLTAGEAGITGEGYYSDREPTRYTVSLETPIIDPTVFAARAIAYLRRHRTPRPIIAFDAFASEWESEPGDGVVLDSFPVLPGLLGQRELTGLVEVLSVARRPFDSATVRVTARVLDADVTVLRARWAPGLRVASAASGSEFTLAEEFIPPRTFGGPFSDDVDTAIPGLVVELYDQHFALRTPERPSIVSVAGQTVTLDAAFGVVPEAGDVVMPAPVEHQPLALRDLWAYYEDADVDYAVFWG